MNTPLLAVDGLRVDYEDITAVRDVSFTVEAGMVYGLIGPNGAGKTSTMEAITTLVEPTYGDIYVGGVNVLEEPTRALPRIGYMPDFPPLYEDLTVREFLDLFASAYGLERSKRRSRIDELLAVTRLAEKDSALAGDLSRGMKQRLFLAKALIHDPALLILDEPASGLDPGARAELSALMRDLGEMGKAVLVSSHILSEMQDFCNSVGIMEQGDMVVSGRIEDVLADMQAGRTMHLALVAPDVRLQRFLEAQEGLTDIVVRAEQATFQIEGGPREASELLSAIVGAGFALADFTAQEHSLQDIFMEVSTGKVA